MSTWTLEKRLASFGWDSSLAAHETICPATHNGRCRSGSPASFQLNVDFQLHVEVQVFLGFQQIPHLDRIISVEEHQAPVGTEGVPVRNGLLSWGNQLVRIKVGMLNALFRHLQLADHAMAGIDTEAAGITFRTFHFFREECLDLFLVLLGSKTSMDAW